MLTGPRKAEQKMSDGEGFGVSAGVIIYQGALVVLNDGYAEGGAVATGLASVGVAQATVDNSAGADGDVIVETRKGVWKFANADADPITIANIGSDCFVFDDETVAATDGGATRSVAGKIMNVDANGVWVKF